MAVVADESYNMELGVPKSAIISHAEQDAQNSAYGLRRPRAPTKLATNATTSPKVCNLPVPLSCTAFRAEDLDLDYAVSKPRAPCQVAELLPGKVSLGPLPCMPWEANPATQKPLGPQALNLSLR